MPKLSGILGNTFGHRITIRGYAKYEDIIKYSYSDNKYQRPSEEKHVDEIKKFIEKSSNVFSPEVILGYTLSGKFLLDDPMLSGPFEAVSKKLGFTLTDNSVNFKYSKTKNEYTITFPKEKKIFRRIDGNHRLLALEKIIHEKHQLSNYYLPFCIILFEDDDSSKQDEKTIFFNINSKAVPVRTEHMLNGILPENITASFGDSELKNNFGMEYFAARKIEQNYPVVIEKIKMLNWASDEPYSLLLHLIQYITKDVTCDLEQTIEQNHIANALQNAIDNTVNICTEKACYSGVIFALAKLFFVAAHGEKNTDKISCFISWVKRNELCGIQPNESTAWEINGDNILNYFEKHLDSQQHTIFLSRCFDTEYNEIENAVSRVIKNINEQFGTSIKLQRVDQHEAGCAGYILGRVQEMMVSCGLVIADLSSGKPNVHHEIGMAMGMNKPVILLHRGLGEKKIKTNIPSNISMMDQIRFDTHDYEKLRNELTRHLQNFYKL